MRFRLLSLTTAKSTLQLTHRDPILEHKGCALNHYEEVIQSMPWGQNLFVRAKSLKIYSFLLAGLKCSITNKDSWELSSITHTYTISQSHAGSNKPLSPKCFAVFQKEEKLFGVSPSKGKIKNTKPFGCCVVKNLTFPLDGLVTAIFFLFFFKYDYLYCIYKYMENGRLINTVILTNDFIILISYLD